MGRIKQKNGKAPTKLTPKITTFCITRSATHSVGAIVDELCKSTEFPAITKRNAPSENTILYQLKKFKTKFTIEDLRKSCKRRPVSATGITNTLKVTKIHQEKFSKYRFKKHASVRYIANRTGISRESVRIINKARLRLKFYKRTKAPKSTPHSIQARLEFAVWGDELYRASDGSEAKKIELLRDRGFYVDETSVQRIHPHNPKNDGIWREKMPEGNENLHHTYKPESVMAFVVISKLLPDNGVYMHWCPPGNMDKFAYHEFLRDKIFPALKIRVGIKNWETAWWLEDGAPPHRSRLVSDFLNDEFGGKVVGSDFLNWHPDAPGANWPPYSCDLTPNDFYLNNRIKDLCWELEEETGLIKNKNDLRRNFEMACYGIDVVEIHKAIDSVPERVKICEAVGGGAFEKYKYKIRKILREK